jgi:acetoacetyl-CoA synthetase
MVHEGELLWQPGAEWVADTNLSAFREWLLRQRGLAFADYHGLWRWSVEHLEDFWGAVWEYFDIEASSPYTQVLGSREMPGAEWFPGAKLNYAQHVLRQETADTAALFHASENTPFAPLAWSQLANDVRVLASRFRQFGIQPGERIAGYMPNIPEAVIAVLASASIGAVWSGCSPDFGTRSVLDRFAQIGPRVLICVDGYSYGGKPFDRRAEVRQIVAQLPTVEHVIFLPYLDRQNETPPVPAAVLWREILNSPPVSADQFEFAQVPFDHPLWILYSSGTTGLPKAIVHGHGGIMIEQMKLSTFHMNLKRDDRLFFFTTTGWMMWNFLVSSMLIGVRPVLYDGNPTYPRKDTLWQLVETSGAKFFGASPTFVQMQERFGVIPREKFDLSSLDSVMVAGSPVSAECMAWFYDNVKRDLWVCPGSGGTDICSGFVGGAPGLPVYAGEIQAPHLGVDVQAFDDQQNAVVNQVGEMVIAQPMPSMPLYFWNDAGNARYRETYFADFPGVWRQGDYFRINERDGCFVLGRSDATLNRYGVRIGTAEIYRSVEALDEVDDAMIVNLDLPGGRFFMPLFVKLADGLQLNEEIEARICSRLRSDYSPRHVPDGIYQVKEIPYTLTGKKMEIPVRKILLGSPPDQAANRSAMANPESLDFFVQFARERKDDTAG